MNANTLLTQVVPALGALALLTAPCLEAAEISWSTPQTISNDSDVRTNGSLVYALNLNGPDVTLNTVPFVGVDVGFDLGDAGNALPPFTDLSADYQTLLRSAFYADNEIATVFLSGLTVGLQYELQIWVHHSDDGYGAFLWQEEDEFFNYVYVPSSEVGQSYLGSHVLGTFTADDVSQSFFIGTEGISVLNALQLRVLDGTTDIPEAGTTFAGLILSLGAFGVWYRRRTAAC